MPHMCSHTYMQRLFSDHQHPMFCILSHIFIHIQGCHGDVDASR